MFRARARAHCSGWRWRPGDTAFTSWMTATIRSIFCIKAVPEFSQGRRSRAAAAEAAGPLLWTPYGIPENALKLTLEQVDSARIVSRRRFGRSRVGLHHSGDALPGERGDVLQVAAELGGFPVMGQRDIQNPARIEMIFCTDRFDGLHDIAMGAPHQSDRGEIEYPPADAGPAGWLGGERGDRLPGQIHEKTLGNHQGRRLADDFEDSLAIRG